MLELLKYELKKIVMRKSARYTCLAVLVALCGIMALNVVQTKTTNNTGEVLSGFDAIHYRQDSAAAHEGTLTDERISQELESYYNVTFEKIDPEELAQMSGSAAYDTITRLYDEQTVQFIYDDYFSWLIRPWAPYPGMEPTQVSAFIGAHPDTTLEEALASLAQRTLDANMQGAWTYSDSERAFWTAKQAEVTHPLSYGYAGGWSNIIDCIAFVSFAILAVCVALAPVFAGEYADRTDSVLLSSRYGRTRLLTAKILASLLFAAGYFALCALIICGGPADSGARDGITLRYHRLPSGADIRRAGVSHDHGICRADAAALLAPALDAGRLRHRRGARAGDGHDPHGRHRHSAAYPVPFPHIAFRTRPVLVLYVLSRRRLRDRRDRRHRNALPFPGRRLRPAGRRLLQAASGGVATPEKQAETFCQRAARTRRAAPSQCAPGAPSSRSVRRPAPPPRRHPPNVRRPRRPPFDLLRHLTRPPMWRIVRPAIQRGSAFGAANRIVSAARRKRTPHADRTAPVPRLAGLA